MTRHGAESDTWHHWDVVLGVGKDLLPVVSRPGDKISPKSDLKTIGKTPSVYNRQRLVIGIPGWADHETTGEEVSLWSGNPDFGMCVVCRRVRGIDIDVEDVSKAEAIVKAVESHLGFMLPLRYRDGVGKCLLAFEMPGNFGKRTIPVEGGVIEILLSRQQFVVEGDHFKADGTPSGTRYEWFGGTPDDIPALTVEAFEALWAMLVERFAVGEPTIARERIEGGADLEGVTDEVALWLPVHWTTYGVQAGKLLTLCPWKADHTSDSGETEAAWLIAGGNGVEQGHFRCMHAHCQGKSDTDFLDAVGYRISGFDVVAEAPRGPRDIPLKNGHDPVALMALQQDIPLPGLKRRKARGDGEGLTSVPVATVTNVVRVLQGGVWLGWDLCYDTFRSEMMISVHGTGEWRPITDGDVTRLRIAFEALSFDPVSKEMVRDAIDQIGEDTQFDTAQLWLESLPPWDGVERVPRFMADYMGCADTEYAKAVGLYMWTGHAGRVMEPGCKADMATILVGNQGAGKTRGVMAIAPHHDFFCEIGFHEKDDDFSRKMRGALVAEVAELRGLNSRDAQTIKAQMSRRFEKWTPKFKEYNTAFPRRLMFWGTSNEDEILADSTGERRWLPIRVEREVDVDAIERDRDQLWAEGLARWRKSGITWREAEKLARSEHGKFKVTDPWMERIERWLHEEDLAGVSPWSGNGFKLEVVAVEVLGLSYAGLGKREEMRIGKILRELGLTRTVQRMDGSPTRLWRPLS